jgi:hypothetical protein
VARVKGRASRGGGKSEHPTFNINEGAEVHPRIPRTGANFLNTSRKGENPKKHEKKNNNKMGSILICRRRGDESHSLRRALLSKQDIT